MKSSTFVKLLAAVVILSATYGSVFAGGVVYGKSSAPETATAAAVVALPTATSAPQGAQSGNFTFTADEVANVRQRLEQQFGGEIPPQLDAALDQAAEGGAVTGSPFRGGPGGGQRGDGGFLFGGGQGQGNAGAAAGTGQRLVPLSGTIKERAGDRIVLETSQGEVNVALDAATTVEKQTVTTLDRDALTTGQTAIIRGERQADGTVHAAQIVLN